MLAWRLQKLGCGISATALLFAPCDMVAGAEGGLWDSSKPRARAVHQRLSWRRLLRRGEAALVELASTAKINMLPSATVA